MKLQNFCYLFIYVWNSSMWFCFVFPYGTKNPKNGIFDFLKLSLLDLHNAFMWEMVNSNIRFNFKSKQASCNRLCLTFHPAMLTYFCSSLQYLTSSLIRLWHAIVTSVCDQNYVNRMKKCSVCPSYLLKIVPTLFLRFIGVASRHLLSAKDRYLMVPWFWWGFSYVSRLELFSSWFRYVAVSVFSLP